MTTDPIRQFDHSPPRFQGPITELQALIRARYPDATFAVEIGEDPEGVYLIATVDLEDTDEVLDAYIDRLVDLQVTEGLPLHVLPVRPPHRIAAMLQERSRAPEAKTVVS